MLQSYIIDINGNFVGAAVRLDKGYRFVSVDIRVEELDGTIWPSLITIQQLVRELFIAGRFTPPAAHSLPNSAPPRAVAAL